MSDEMSSVDSIGLDEARAIVRSACGDEPAEVLDYRLEPYSKHSLGFLGVHQKLEITLKSGDSTRKLSFFVKSTPSACNDQVSFIQDNQIFRQEAAFFNEVTPRLLEAVAAGAGAVANWAPECYLASGRVIVQEDLREQGFAMCPDKILEGERLRAVARTLARLHSASMLAERQLGKPLNELYSQACSEQIFNEKSLKFTLPLLESLAKEVADKHDRKTERVHQVLMRVHDFMIENKGEQKVMSHGDTWANNVMLDKSEPLPKCLLVDYQLVRYAPRMFDIAQMIHLNTTSEIRKREEKKTIEAYRQELAECLRKCDPECEIPTLEQLIDEYEKTKVIGQTLAMLYFPTILLSQEIHAEYEGNMEALYKKYVYRPNNDCVFELMERDKKYNDRITDVVLDFLNTCDKMNYSKSENRV